jgi:hypothetical protein
MAEFIICDQSIKIWSLRESRGGSLGQVESYIEILERDRNAILANDGEDTSKIRAKIIIGGDGNEAQTATRRRFNGHLHRIEGITFDQLVKIAERVLDYLEFAFRPNPRISNETAARQPFTEDDIPF